MNKLDNIGKKRRLSRIFDSHDNRTIIVQMDRSSFKGPVRKMDKFERTYNEIISNGINSILINEGMINRTNPYLKNNMGLIIPIPFNSKIDNDRIIFFIENAIAYGADGVLVTFENNDEIPHIKYLYEICETWNLPMIVSIKSELDEKIGIMTDIGADIIQIPYSSNFEEIDYEPIIPIIISDNNELLSQEEITGITKQIIENNYNGISLSNTVTQSTLPAKTVKIINDIIHNNQENRI